MNLFISHFESAFYYLISISSFDHFLFLILFGIVFQLKDWKPYLALLLAIIIGSLAGLLLSDLKLLTFSWKFKKLMIYSAILATGIHHISSPNISSNVIRYNFFAITGIILGACLSNHYNNVTSGNSSILKFSGYNVGCIAAYFVITASSIMVSSLFMLVLKTDRRSYILTLSGIGIGISLVLFYLRYS